MIQVDRPEALNALNRDIIDALDVELDKIADVAFGAGKWLKDDDDTRLQVLFKSYTRMTGSSEV